MLLVLFVGSAGNFPSGDFKSGGESQPSNREDAPPITQRKQNDEADQEMKLLREHSDRRPMFLPFGYLPERLEADLDAHSLSEDNSSSGRETRNWLFMECS
jgi:hypothetical protein